MSISPENLEIIDAVATILARSRSLFVITGAGISADSGLPTYRGIGGLYEMDETEEGMPIEDLLSGDTWMSNPAVTWKYLGRVEESARGAQFNRAHEVIAEMEKRYPHCCVLTQNIDGFHHDAGSENILEIHGNMHHIHCIECHWSDEVPDYSGLGPEPRCPLCGNWVRPTVVLFGEMLPTDTVEELYRETYRQHDVVMVIGTSAMFPYIASPAVQAASNGTPVVEINPSETSITPFASYRLPLRAAEALDAIWLATQEKIGG